jgi:hypothetical protein
LHCVFFLYDALALSILEDLKFGPISLIPNIEIEINIELGIFQCAITHPKDLEELMSPTKPNNEEEKT